MLAVRHGSQRNAKPKAKRETAARERTQPGAVHIAMQRPQSVASLHRSQSAGALPKNRAANGAPSLDSALAMEGWRHTIKSENASTDKLQRTLLQNEFKRREAFAKAARGHHVSMPMPPCAMALMMNRLKDRPQSRELAVGRVMTRTNTSYSELFADTTPWARQLALAPYAPQMNVRASVAPPSRAALRPGSAAHTPASFRTPWR